MSEMVKRTCSWSPFTVSATDLFENHCGSRPRQRHARDFRRAGTESVQQHWKAARRRYQLVKQHFGAIEVH